MHYPALILGVLAASLATGTTSPRRTRAHHPQRLPSLIMAATELHAPTYALAVSWPGSNGSVEESLRCRKLGPQCMELGPPSRRVSARVYCKRAHAAARLRELRPVWLSPCAAGSSCRVSYGAARKPPPAHHEFLLWSEDEDGGVPGLAFEDDVAAWIDIDAFLRRVGGDGGDSKRAKAAGVVTIPYPAPAPNSTPAHHRPAMPGRRPPPFQFSCVASDGRTG
ncbi:hypothetical protein F4823DRAFT_568340 [Ustulina deusta]|nr:hypothetical protein F4823DRAFT_568340 [Ustulina deusta]